MNNNNKKKNETTTIKKKETLHIAVEYQNGQLTSHLGDHVTE